MASLASFPLPPSYSAQTQHFQQRHLLFISRTQLLLSYTEFFPNRGLTLSIHSHCESQFYPSRVGPSAQYPITPSTYIDVF